MYIDSVKSDKAGSTKEATLTKALYLANAKEVWAEIKELKADEDKRRAADAAQQRDDAAAAAAAHAQQQRARPAEAAPSEGAAGPSRRARGAAPESPMNDASCLTGADEAGLGGAAAKRGANRLANGNGGAGVGAGAGAKATRPSTRAPALASKRAKIDDGSGSSATAAQAAPPPRRGLAEPRREEAVTTTAQREEAFSALLAELEIAPRTAVSKLKKFFKTTLTELGV
jgi:hypothetical protein